MVSQAHQALLDRKAIAVTMVSMVYLDGLDRKAMLVYPESQDCLVFEVLREHLE